MKTTISRQTRRIPKYRSPKSRARFTCANTTADEKTPVASQRAHSRCRVHIQATTDLSTSMRNPPASRELVRQALYHQGRLQCRARLGYNRAVAKDERRASHAPAPPSEVHLPGPCDRPLRSAGRRGLRDRPLAEGQPVLSRGAQEL